MELIYLYNLKEDHQKAISKTSHHGHNSSLFCVDLVPAIMVTIHLYFVWISFLPSWSQFIFILLGIGSCQSWLIFRMRSHMVCCLGYQCHELRHIKFIVREFLVGTKCWVMALKNKQEDNYIYTYKINKLATMFFNLWELFEHAC